MRWARRRAGLTPDGTSSTLWALDLEMTGLDATVDHIIEIGVVPIVDRRIRLDRAWTSLVRPPDYRSSGTVAHGIMPDDLENAPDPTVVLDQFWDRVGDDPLVVHHTGVDRPFLVALHRSVGRPWTEPAIIDTVDFLDRRNRRRRQLGEPELPLQLAHARQALGLPAAPQHRALDDAVATAELWLALTAGQSSGATADKR